MLQLAVTFERPHRMQGLVSAGHWMRETALGWLMSTLILVCFPYLFPVIYWYSHSQTVQPFWHIHQHGCHLPSSNYRVCLQNLQTEWETCQATSEGCTLNWMNAATMDRDWFHLTMYVILLPFTSMRKWKLDWCWWLCRCHSRFQVLKAYRCSCSHQEYWGPSTWCCAAWSGLTFSSAQLHGLEQRTGNTGHLGMSYC